MKLVAWGKSDTGRKRDHNEDSFLVAPERGLFAVADGMGGHQGGETASRLALEVLEREIYDALDDLAAVARRLEDERRSIARRVTEEMEIPGAGDFATQDEPTSPNHPLFDPHVDVDPDAETDPRIAAVTPPAITVMRAAATEASFAIFDAALEDPALRGMGTTLTAMLYDSGRMYVAHAGDSRAYLFRDGRLRQLTDDHSWTAEQVKAGAMTEEEARESQFRHIITRSVGFERNVDVDLRGVAVEAGDCFLLCSDGMSNYVDNGELERLLATTWYRRAPALLVDVANERGGDDNITVVVVYIGNDLS